MITNKFLAEISSKEKVDFVNFSDLEPKDLGRIIAALRANTNLESIYFYHNQFSPEAWEGLFDTFQGIETLRELIFIENNLSEAKALAKAITENQALTSFALQEPKISDEGIKDLVLAIENNKSLKEFRLTNMYLSLDNLRMLHDVIQDKLSLKTIILDNAGIDNEGAIIIANALVQNPSLIKVDLPRNNIWHKISDHIKSITDTHKLSPKAEIKPQKLYLDYLPELPTKYSPPSTKSLSKTALLSIDAAIHDEGYAIPFDNVAKAMLDLPIMQGIKVADTFIDVLRLAHTYSYEHLQEVVVDINQLCGMYYGNNLYTSAIIVANALANIQQGQIAEAVYQSAASFAFISAASIIANNDLLADIYAFGVAGYALYELGRNAYEFYQETVESSI